MDYILGFSDYVRFGLSFCEIVFVGCVDIVLLSMICCPEYSSPGENFRGPCVAKDPMGAEHPILGFAVCLTGFQPGPGTRLC